MALILSPPKSSRNLTSTQPSQTLPHWSLTSAIGFRKVTEKLYLTLLYYVKNLIMRSILVTVKYWEK